MDFAFGRSNVQMMKCPCNRCSLTKLKSREDMEGDLMCYGFLSSYTSWILHGEEIRITENARVPSDIARVQLDSTSNLLDDLFLDINMNMQGEYGNDSSEQPMNSDIPSTAGEIMEEEKILRSYLLIIIKSYIQDALISRSCPLY